MLSYFVLPRSSLDPSERNKANTKWSSGRERERERKRERERGREGEREREREGERCEWKRNYNASMQPGQSFS